MKFELSERLTTQREEREIYNALLNQFSKISEEIKEENGIFKAKMIEASFGSINRKDETVVSIKPLDGGHLLIAEVLYRPSIAFWVILAITIFSYIGWIIPIGFYVYQKKTVSNAIKACFNRVQNEFSQQSKNPQQSQNQESFETILERLAKLKSAGAITESEFQERKSSLLQRERQKTTQAPAEAPFKPPMTNRESEMRSEGIVRSKILKQNTDTPHQADLPSDIKGWSWGGLLLNGFWAIGNKTWIGLLSFVPVIGLPMPFILGYKGREWAWRNRDWESIDQFNQVQKRWSIAGAIIYATVFGLIMLGQFAPSISDKWHYDDAKELAFPNSKDLAIKPEDNHQKTEGQSAHESNESELATSEPDWILISSQTPGNDHIFETHAGALRLEADAEFGRFITLNGKRLFNGDDSVWQRPVMIFRMPDESEAVLVESSGGRGTSCETLFFFLLIDKKGAWQATPMFGTCANDGTIRQVNETIELKIPRMGGVTDFKMRNGAIFEQGRQILTEGATSPFE